MTDQVWIRTEPTVDGSKYVVTIEASEDRAVTLTPKRVLRYASAVLEAAARAEYDAAVFRQMYDVIGDKTLAAQVITDLRKDRPPLDHRATAPLRLDPGVNQDIKPFIAVYVDDEQVGQWSLPDTKAHALGVLEAVTAADLDSGYYRVLRGVVGLDEGRARNVVGDLGRWRDQ